jgi:hypothetical protein
LAVVRISLSNLKKLCELSPDAREAGMTSCGPLFAIAMALSVLSAGASPAEQSGTLASPPPVVIKNLIQSSDEQHERDREAVTAELAQTCLEQEDQRVCEMELELGEVTIPH